MRIKLVKSYQMLRIEPISKSLRNSLKKKKNWYEWGFPGGQVAKTALALPK